RRAIQHSAILQSKSGAVKWTFDTVANQFAFRKRSAEVGTGVCHGEQTASATNQQNRDALVYNLSGFIVRQLEISQHRHKIPRERVTCRPVHAHSVLVNHFSAQVSCVRHEPVTKSCTETRGTTETPPGINTHTRCPFPAQD